MYRPDGRGYLSLPVSTENQNIMCPYTETKTKTDIV